MAKKRATKTLNLPAADYGTAELHQRVGVEIVDISMGSGNATQKGARVIHECVLDTYLKRGQVTDRHHVTGIKVRGLWERATGGASLVAGYDDMVSGMAVMSEDSIDARDILMKALRRLEGHQGKIVVGVCGCNEWAGDVMVQIGGRSKRAAPQELRDGLDALADMWGIPRYETDGSKWLETA